MLAGCFYDLIEDDRIFDVVEKPKAWTAAFLILHESEIYQATSLYASRRYYINSASTFKLLLNQAKKTLSRRIAVVSYLKPLSLMSQAEAMVSNIRMNDQAQDKWHYSERNISDYAAMMYALYPDQEDELYGTGEAEDRTLMYNAKHVEKLINNLLDWFSIKVSTRLG